MSTTVTPEGAQGQTQVRPPVTITSYYSQRSNDAAGAPRPAAPCAGAQQDEDFLNWETSGLFTVPMVANPLTVHIYVSSFIQDTVTVQLVINKLINPEKAIVFQTAVPVPGQGAIEIALDAGGLDLKGETIEVVFRSPDPDQYFQLMPSVDVVEFFPADGATLPLLFIPPGNFDRVFPGTGQTTALQPPPPILRTTGIFDVPQGVFAVRPQVTVVLSSFSDETLTADVVVNRLVRGITRKETVLTRSVDVPPGEERQFTVDSVEGLPIEVNFTLTRDEMGFALLPSVHVTRLFTADNTVDSVLLVPAGGLMAVFPDQ